MPSDRRVIDGVAHVVLRDPSRTVTEVLVPIAPPADRTPLAADPTPVPPRP